MTIGITGATGQLGRLVVAALTRRVPSASVVALARIPEAGANLGVEVREADYDRPDTLDRSLVGIDTLLLISGDQVRKRVVQHRNVIEAAKGAGVKRIVYTSLLHADRSNLSIAPDHRATEEELRRAGIPFTLNRHGWYMENYTASIPGVLAGGAVLGSAKDGRISAATRADYADAAVVVLTNEGHEGKVYELAGDESFTLSDLAAELSRQTGRIIPYEDLSEADYAAALKRFGMPERVAKAFAAFDVEASRGALFDDGHQLAALIGRPTTSLSAAVTKALAQPT